jgi:hypothetical protein
VNKDTRLLTQLNNNNMPQLSEMISNELKQYLKEHGESTLSPEDIAARDVVQRINKQVPVDKPGTRKPTAEEVKEIQSFIQSFRKSNPHATDREIKRAVKKKFNVNFY